MPDKSSAAKAVKGTIQSITNAVADASISSPVSPSAESQPNLVKDDETGEMISKSERESYWNRVRPKVLH
jgi:hypothetical protein